MTGLSKLWTTSVAYVSLLFGAGLSVAGNLADTYRIRGSLTDAVDIVLAVGPPVASLLVAELFVSAWPRSWNIQALRWAGLLLVGSLAMIVSWSHINELLAARGQNQLVAILWPLAIDGLAIMAMAKILVSRGHVAMDYRNGGPVATTDAVANRWPGWPGPAKLAGGQRVHDHSDLAMATQPDDPTVDAEQILRRWNDGLAEGFQDQADLLAREVEAFANGTPATKTRATPVTPGIPAEARELLEAWDPEELAARDADALLAGHFDKSVRTARRWRQIVSGQPTSGA